MHDLLSIGRFAAVTGLTVKALRLYDQLGLLRPAMVDLASGYRYYSRDQASVAARIRLLRSVHMPLIEIARLLAADDPVVVAATLDHHRRYLTDQLGAYERALRLLPTTEQWLEATRKESPMKTDARTYRCSFCGKANAQVSRMIAGPDDVHICNECVEKCNEIIADAQSRETSA